MRNCFVMGCDQQHKNSPKRAMFLVPKNQDLLNKWIEVLPKVRNLRAHDKVCHLHFRNEDVIFNYEHLINGKMYQLERGRPRLKPDAIPSINLPSLEEIELFLAKPTKRPLKKTITKQNSKSTLQTEAEVDVKKDSFNEQIHFSENEIVATIDQNKCTETADNIDKSDNICHTFTYIYDNYYEVELPNTLWAMHRCPNRTAIFFSFIDVESMLCSKVISITSNGSIKIQVNNRLLYELTLNDDIQTMEMLASLIMQVDDTEICTVD